MSGQTLQEAFEELSTPLVFDACLRLGFTPRIAPGVHWAIGGVSRVAGAVLHMYHSGSINAFLEVLTKTIPGDVVVIDNAGRCHEACIGDLPVLDASVCGTGAIVVWGCHCDTTELVGIGFPVISFGACLAGPRRLDARSSDALIADNVGEFFVTREDVVFADVDGALFVRASRVTELIDVARQIRRTERKQAAAVEKGHTLCEQLHYAAFLTWKTSDPNHTFRDHLRSIGGAIAEQP